MTEPILVTCYVNPDLDGFAGAFAYTEFLNKKGSNAQMGVLGEPHDEVKYVLDRFGLSISNKITDTDSFPEIILVDSSDLNGLGGKVSPEKVIEIIDHRKINEAEKFIKAKVQIELVGAAATLVAERFRQENIPISKEAAILVYSAIISNTLNFKGSVTTERDINISEWLKQFFSAPTDYWKELFMAKSDLTGEKLAERIEGDFAQFTFSDKKIGIAQLEIIGARKLIESRGDEIINILNKIKIDLNLDYIFQNTIELEELKNFIITDDNTTKDLLEKVLEINFEGTVAIRNELIMRKQIVPLIKEGLELL